ncbi:tRNA (guanosine(37)-N1)-methyltransferase TrmD [candidate division FCPU426 bacterium]|nr:tRNA (guanosine(37)-N1)-methyltransferase TrmD [candidate division FCPU426 bacterium]
MAKHPRPLRVNILTIFPELLETSFSYSILKRARTKGLFEPHLVNIRDFSRDRRRTVDDKPYGGGSGMVMKIEPVARALASVRRKGGTGKVFLLAPSGRVFNQELAQALAREDRFTLICGRYEGVDQRVEDKLCAGAISIGDYVLTGGEPAAAVVVDAVVRLLPGVLGAEDSATMDSFSDGLLDYPHYTRPPRYKTWRVPELLLSGDHGRLKNWRREKQLARTWRYRPDLLKNACLSPDDLGQLEKIKGWSSRKSRKDGRMQS